ncbi:MAG TPA: GNAT family N-acetyltransferase [Actinomycetota bacterium]|nr:GNAT family N-acetyltransferase [Actinomycetota bacterium]
MVAPLTSGDVDEAAGLLSLALYEDPIISYMLPDADTRLELGAHNFRGLVRFGVMFGLALGTDPPLGGVLVANPPRVDITPETARAAGLTDRVQHLGRDAVIRQGMLMDHLEAVHRRDLPPDHWYVSIVGVLPNRQRRGVGTALFEPVLARADQDGLPCYLDTAQARNAAFFQSLGFEVLTESEYEPASLMLWTCVREPRRPDGDGGRHAPR